MNKTTLYFVQLLGYCYYVLRVAYLNDLTYEQTGGYNPLFVILIFTADFLVPITLIYVSKYIIYFKYTSVFVNMIFLIALLGVFVIDVLLK
ncbi:MAG: hypothetical protein LPJ89_08690 [Hymenobacteraceae bacterium]|nr:hypothetical protein [Hymenobacteraceae bacterium]